MSLSRLLLAVGLAISLAVTSMPSAALGQERVETLPTDAEINRQIGRLDPKNCERERLGAAKWFDQHSKAKNAHLAVTALEQCIRTDPVATIRDAAVMSLAWIAKNRNEPCPLVIVEAILDKDEYVSQTANALAEQFKTFPPGSVEILLRCAELEDDIRRGNCLVTLAHAGGKHQKVLAALEKARQHKSFGVRHNAHVAMFQATDDLAEFLAYLIRLLEDPDGVLGQVDADSEAGKRDRSARDLGRTSAALLVLEWSDKRPDDLAPALLKLLEAPSPFVRRGAARLIGASAVNFGLADQDGKKLLEPAPDQPKVQKPPQRSNVAVRLEKLKAEERLKELRDGDPDLTVRAAARTALERLVTVREKRPHR